MGMLAWIAMWILVALARSSFYRSLWAEHQMPSLKILRRFQKLGTPSLWLNTVALICLVVGVSIGWQEYKQGVDLNSNIATELVSIAVTVIVLDRMNEWRSQHRYKKSIIHQMGSLSNDFALDAARIAENEGWLFDGSLQGARLNRANLQGAELVRANLHDFIPSEATAPSGASLQDAELVGDLVGANLQGVELVGANLQGAPLWGANLQGAYLYVTNLQDANLIAANLQGVELSGANLQGATLWGAKFQGAYLQGANLQGSTLWGTNLQGAKYNNRTTWPDGFDPIAAGAILIAPAHPTKDKAQSPIRAQQ